MGNATEEHLQQEGYGFASCFMLHATVHQMRNEIQRDELNERTVDTRIRIDLIAIIQNSIEVGERSYYIKSPYLLAAPLCSATYCITFTPTSAFNELNLITEYFGPFSEHMTFYQRETIQGRAFLDTRFRFGWVISRELDLELMEF